MVQIGYLGLLPNLTADLPALGDDVGEDELLVLLAEFRSGVADYLATRSGDVPRTLRDIVDFNRANAGTELAHFGQQLFEKALAGPRDGLMTGLVRITGWPVFMMARVHTVR